MSEPESHWGGNALKGAFLAVVVAVVLMSGLIALFFWSPWKGPTELDWLRTYEAWTEGTEARLAEGERISRASCESSFDDEVGDPPGDRLERAAQAARRGCGALSHEGWRNAQWDVVRALIAVHSEEVAPRYRRDFSEIAGSIAGREAEVRCWRQERWAPFVQHYATLRADEEIRLSGIADTARNRIDLDPTVCATLHRYVRRIRPIPLSEENLFLAEALVVLAHQAEHLESPSTPEPEVECYAVQHVRPLVAATGWGSDWTTEIALHAWDLAYTQLPPHYRTPDCRNDGPLDQNPSSDAWP